MRNEYMKIIFVLRPDIEKLPPVMSQLYALTEQGHDVTVISTRVSAYIKQLYSNDSITFVSLRKAKPDHGILQKMINLFHFRKLVKKHLQSNRDSVVWIGSADTAVYCRDIFYSRPKTILNIYELYDKFPKTLKRVQNIARRASAVIVPEYNRAHILKVWLKLQKMPVVIPNMPYFRETVADSHTAEVMKALAACHKKIVLYQGWISEERDISCIAEAMNSMEEKNEYVLVLMGPLSGEQAFHKIKEKYPNLIHIPYLDPPQHLHITEMAYIGIASYDDSSLNTIFCAPNKIYEYALKNVPMLARAIPGLVYSVESNQVGVCVDTYNVESIINGIRLLDRNHSFYQSNMKAFLEKSNIGVKINEVIRLVT